MVVRRKKNIINLHKTRLTSLTTKLVRNRKKIHFNLKETTKKIKTNPFVCDIS